MMMKRALSGKWDSLQSTKESLRAGKLFRIFAEHNSVDDPALVGQHEEKYAI